MGEPGCPAMAPLPLCVARNRLYGKALAGDAEYAQFLGGGHFAQVGPVASGLAGPVTLQIEAMK